MPSGRAARSEPIFSPACKPTWAAAGDRLTPQGRAARQLRVPQLRVARCPEVVRLLVARQLQLPAGLICSSRRDRVRGAAIAARAAAAGVARGEEAWVRAAG